MCFRILMVFSFLLTCFSVNADGISLNQSRVIFPSNSNSQFVQVNNDSKEPLLIQASVINEIEGSAVDTFLTTPPLFKMEPKSEFSVRIVPNNVQNLPKDRESLFYFKIRAIPAIKKHDDKETQSSLVFVTAFIIKLYYRPAHLTAPTKVHYQQVTLVKNQGEWEFRNPTPYYMTLVDVNADGNAKEGSLLLAPLSEYPLKDINRDAKNITWRFLNDFGVSTDKYTTTPINK